MWRFSYLNYGYQVCEGIEDDIQREGAQCKAAHTRCPQILPDFAAFLKWFILFLVYLDLQSSVDVLEYKNGKNSKEKEQEVCMF